MKKTLLLVFTLAFFFACSEENAPAIERNNTPEVKEDPETQEQQPNGVFNDPINDYEDDDMGYGGPYYNPDYDYDGAIESLKVSETVGTINEPYSFAPIIDSDTWLIPNTDTRIAACQVPEDILKNLTTEALVTTCLRFPFGFSYTAYDNLKAGMQRFIDEFNGYQELKKRPDAVYELLKKMRSINPDEIAQEYRENKHHNAIYEADLSVFAPSYIDIVLATNYFPEIFEGKALEVLYELAKWQHHQSEANRDIYGVRTEIVMLGAQIRLHQGDLNEKNTEILQNFLKDGYYHMKENGVYMDFSKKIWQLIRIE
ncbi:MAG: hypothetical protein IJL37_09125 [Bacteroidaceae bacterium]|nr:hypothetical protein [Bacteroidaceae bacterium]